MIINDEQIQQMRKEQAIICANAAMGVMVSKCIPYNSSIAQEIYKAIIKTGEVDAVDKENSQCQGI